MKLRRDLLFVLALFAGLTLFIIAGPGRPDEDPIGDRPTTYSSAPRGALALLRWADELGYEARRLEFREYAVDAQTDLLFLLGPSVRPTPDAVTAILEWVAAGGTLVLAEDDAAFFVASDPLLDELGVTTRVYTGADPDGLPATLVAAPVVQPVFNEPALQTATVEATSVLELSRADAAPLLAADDAVVLAGFPLERGYVYVSSSSYPFTNQGLRDAQNAALVLNLLQRAPAGGQVVFDEYHHGFFAPPSLRQIVLSSPWGWALIYGLTVTVAYLLLTGRRFGRPVPLREEVARRSSSEYVASMADLFLRGGQRAFIATHYRVAFKRRLARPFGINPQLTDDEFVREIARYTTIDQVELQRVLAQLRRPPASEEALLRAIAAADQFAAPRA